MSENLHKAGFVNILGRPNVGKSTLMNALVGEKLSIITSKAQTTRHRIMGIINSPDFQVVYSDTPGIIKPKYELQNSMMRFVNNSIEDADVILFLLDINQQVPDPEKNDLYRKTILTLEQARVPIILVLNKIDLLNKSEIAEKLPLFEGLLKNVEIIPVSALNHKNIDTLFEKILEKIPEHPPYFPKDEITDKPERFFAEEIIREKIFLNYEQEIPYSTEVAVISFKEDEKIIRISAEIFVERKSQKGIIIGKGGQSLKKVGVEARADLEAFFDKQVFLETFVKVEPDWR
ncbi:MAG: GTPase Era, partial [Cyclobacteriaceae bacterium]